jgi:hypothetical protein
MVDVTLSMGSKSVGTNLLLDSGADFSMIQREFAENVLGIKIESLQKGGTHSASGQMDVVIVNILVTLTQATISKSFEAPFQIPINTPGFPALQLLGREPLFHLFDVAFRMGYTDVLGKFTLRCVEKKHNPSRFRIGGKPLVPESMQRR